MRSSIYEAYILPVQCHKCGKLFDFNEDLKEGSYESFEEVLKEKCGASELLCRHCRECKD